MIRRGIFLDTSEAPPMVLDVSAIYMNYIWNQNLRHLRRWEENVSLFSIRIMREPQVFQVILGGPPSVPDGIIDGFWMMRRIEIIVRFSCLFTPSSFVPSCFLWSCPRPHVFSSLQHNFSLLRFSVPSSPCLFVFSFLVPSSSAFLFLVPSSFVA